ncbi:OB-fold domain-containing protein [Jatrophihabitans sp.]|uniref:Zn-ribbon domain-containing OB-fold protein n=1 Tax=Jatrophihabitans sp. TaxID=1932789 RepID=UPI0030C66AB6|nr:hypothetical protein [Jatrophihabitans sp.]
MADQVPRPLPMTEDEDTSGYWQAASEGRLVVQECLSCHAVLHLPKPFCHHCESWDVGWREVSGDGTVFSWTVVEHQVHAAFPVPYTIVLVELVDAPGARLIGHLDGAPELTVGQPLRVRFVEPEPGVTVPTWELVS